MTEENSRGKKCGQHFIVRNSKLGEQKRVKVVIFLVSHQLLFTMKQMTPPFFLPDSSILSMW